MPAHKDTIMPKRKSKIKFGGFALTHTRLKSADEGATYELWNTLQMFQAEKQVLKALNLPAGVLPIGPKGRLIFGEGNFGKVRLAKRKKQFLAVKKTDWEQNKELEQQTAYKEYLFSQRLNKIPNTAAIEAVLEAEGANGKKKLYQFMPLATLGDGNNLKKLLGNLDRKDRDVVIKYITFNLIQTLSTMHSRVLYHRDLKPANILINNNGEIYFSDFGSAIANPNHDPRFEKSLEVSRQVDQHYLPPEMVEYIATLRAQPDLNYAELLDTWRFGLTILSLCGAVKFKEGLLAHSGSLTVEQQSNIYAHDQALLDDIKNQDPNKIPHEIQEALFGLLEVNPMERLSANEAMQKLQINLNRDQIKDIFEVLTKSQIAQGIISGIEQALNKEYVSDPLKEYEKTYPKNSREYFQKKSELNKHYQNILKEFKDVIKNPELKLHDLNTFLRRFLKKRKLPNLNRHQFNYLLARSRLRYLKKQTSIAEHHQNFNQISIFNQNKNLQRTMQDFATRRDLTKALTSLRELFLQLRSFNYFVSSFPFFYDVDATFHDTAKLARQYREHYQKFAHDVIRQLKKEIIDLEGRLKHLQINDLQDFKNRLQIFKDIEHSKSDLLEMMHHCGFSSKSLHKLNELFQHVAALNPDHLDVVEQKQEPQPTFEIRGDKPAPTYGNVVERESGISTETKYTNVPSTTGVGEYKTNYTNVPTTSPTENRMEVSEIVEVAGTDLFYCREEDRLVYIRTEGYLDRYVEEKGDMEYVVNHGFTNEELLVVNAMVNEFLAAERSEVNLRGNDKLTHLAAQKIHHHNHQVKISINGVPYHDATVSHLHKLLHQSVPSHEEPEKPRSSPDLEPH